MIRVTSFFFYTAAIGDGFLPQPESGIIPHAARLKDILDVCDREVCRHLSTPYSRVHACISMRTIPIENPAINHGTVYNLADPTIIRSYGMRETSTESQRTLGAFYPDRGNANL